MGASVFLDDNNTVKLGDFGLSKQLAQASFANTYVGVSVAVDSSVITLINFFHSLDPILYVPRAYARESLRLKIGYLVARMPNLRTLRLKTSLSRSQNSCRTQYIYSVCNEIPKKDPMLILV